MFAYNHSVDVQRARSFEWSDVATYTGSDVESDADDVCEWDITWSWEEDWLATDIGIEEHEMVIFSSPVDIESKVSAGADGCTGDWEAFSSQDDENAALRCLLEVASDSHDSEAVRLIHDD